MLSMHMFNKLIEFQLISWTDGIEMKLIPTLAPFSFCDQPYIT